MDETLTPVAVIKEAPAPVSAPEHRIELGYSAHDDGVWLRCSCQWQLNLGFSATPEGALDAARAHRVAVGGAVFSCPRCGRDRLFENRMICPACWAEAPIEKRRRWCSSIIHIQKSHPAALAILAWAQPDNPPKAPPRPAGKAKKPEAMKCRKCKGSMQKPHRGSLARLLKEILPTGLPKQVRERAEQVARRLDGWCETCAAAPQEGGQP